MPVPAAWRPRFHVRAAGSWINDPHGPIFWDGAYHLFFQHNPRGLDWGPPAWGHAVSEDLVHWTLRDDALTPTPGGPDAGGCWSGCLVASDGTVYALYTGVTGNLAQSVCAATSDADLTRWRKLPLPLITAPSGVDPEWFRDPYVLRHGDRWLCVVGAGAEGVAGSALLYSSADLLRWDYVGPLYERDCSLGEPVFTGDMWECPQLFQLDDRYVLGISVRHRNRPERTAYFLGDFDGRSFTPTSGGRLDFGPDYYAATSMSDPAGRRLVWGWSWEALADDARRANGLAGCLSLPRTVRLVEGRLWLEPIEELSSLRDVHVTQYAGELADRRPVTLVADAGTGFDIAARLLPLGCDRIELDVFSSPYGLERTVVFLDAAAGLVGIDTTGSTLLTEARTGVYSTPVDLHSGRPIDVRIIGDGSLLEVFLNGHPFTVRVYPTRQSSRSVRIRALGGAALVRRANVWTISASTVRASRP